MFVSKPLKLSILTVLTVSLFLGGALGVNAQNTGQTAPNGSSAASIFTVDGAKQRIGHIWQDTKGEYVKLLSQSKDIQAREIMAGIKEEWKKEINEMKQDIVEHWRELKERIKLWKTP